MMSTNLQTNTDTAASAAVHTDSPNRVSFSGLPQGRREIVDAAMAFPMHHILKRYMKDENLTREVALEHERELKRFLAICAINPDRMIGMSGRIDELWHTFLMFTWDYHEFCSSIAGRYIHHSPRDESEDIQLGRAAYRNFWNAYEAAFGESPPAHLWPALLSKDGDLTACTGSGCCGSHHGTGTRPI